MNQIQRKIMELIVAGYPQSQIAEQLNLSEITISLIIHSAIQQLQADNLVEAISIYLRQKAELKN